MRTNSLFLLVVLAATSLDAASYQKTNGTIVDPILRNNGTYHSYSGPNLEPGVTNIGPSYGADLSQAMLAYADLNGAHLSNTKLGYANLFNANLADAAINSVELNNSDMRGANLTDAYAAGVTLTNANLFGATLTGANLYNSDFIVHNSAF